tara:strand:- start:782 stop:1705 length:924 start_codon:yes stop_codon:yes gene_type:complete
MASNEEKTGRLQVQSCYTNWSKSYFEEYLGENAEYPPIHVSLIDTLLKDVNARIILDAGCGPASMIRLLHNDERSFFGFDLTPSMIDEAKKVGTELGISPERFWVGDTCNPNAYSPPSGLNPENGYDAAVCSGVLPHLTYDEIGNVFENLHAAVIPGGRVIVEARNKLFSLFSFNRYSHEFILNDLIQATDLKSSMNGLGIADDDVFEEIERLFRTDLPPIRVSESNDAGYDEITSNTHNPLTLKPYFEQHGFKNVAIDFYHFHPLPPIFKKQLPEVFRKFSIKMENSKDWRGHFMASAFLLSGDRE